LGDFSSKTWDFTCQRCGFLNRSWRVNQKPLKFHEPGAPTKNVDYVGWKPTHFLVVSHQRHAGHVRFNPPTLTLIF
jgi:hypothetical protein